MTANRFRFRGMGVNGTWHIGNVSVLTQNVNSVESGSYISNAVGLPFAYQVRPETVGQSTGLVDTNGVEAFEGDIIEFRANYTERERCGWHRGFIVWDTYTWAIKVPKFKDTKISNNSIKESEEQ